MARTRAALSVLVAAATALTTPPAAADAASSSQSYRGRIIGSAGSAVRLRLSRPPSRALAFSL